MGTLKIKKVDDKPMVIHTKKKAKIHMHEPKKAKIKGSNIYTVQRGPKIASAKINDTGKKKSYRKSTIHQAEKKEKEPSKFKRNIRESNTSIKTKNTNLHIAGRTGALAAGAVTEQVEGGQEVSQAAYLAYEVSRPVTGTASRGASLFRKKAAAEAKRRIKKVETGKKLAKKMGKKAASDTAKKVAGDTTKTAAKETAKNTAKETAKTTAKAATTAAGTAVAPGAGTAVGMAAGYATGVSIEAKDVKAANRSRKIKFFLDKMKEQENQTDSVVKLVKDLIVKKAVLWIKAAAPIIGLVLLLLVLLVVISRKLNVIVYETQQSADSDGLAFKQSIAKSKQCYVLLRIMRKIVKGKGKCDRQAVDAEFVIELDGEESKLFKEMFAELLK